MTSLTLAQLNSALTAEQINESRTRSLVSPDPLDPVAQEIAAACAKVDAYIKGWAVPDALATGYARDIAAAHVAKRLSKATQDQEDARDRAFKELEDIRDGKFASLGRSSEEPSLDKVIFGSRKNIL